MRQPLDKMNGVWVTPVEFFDPLRLEFDLRVDTCAIPENTKCPTYFTPEIDGLEQDWTGLRCWMNPPYTRGVIDKWVKKAAQSNAAIVVGLLPSRTDTRWFHDHIYGKAEIRFIRGRLRFSGRKGSGLFGSMLVIWRSQASGDRKAGA